MTELVVCSTHGPRQAVMVCSHLLKRASPNVFVVQANGDDLCQSWCATCEEARMADGGWFERADAAADWALACAMCHRAVVDKALLVTMRAPATDLL